MAKDKITTISVLGTPISILSQRSFKYDEFAIFRLAINSVFRNFRDTEADGKQYNFQLNDDEFQNWTSQIVISNADKMGFRRAPI